MAELIVRLRLCEWSDGCESGGDVHYDTKSINGYSVRYITGMEEFIIKVQPDGIFTHKEFHFAGGVKMIGALFAEYMKTYLHELDQIDVVAMNVYNGNNEIDFTFDVELYSAEFAQSVKTATALFSPILRGIIHGWCVNQKKCQIMES